MKISMIVARAQNGAIGKDNDMIWHLPDDMQYFKDQTRNHHILMGRKNFDSLPKVFRPLKHRVNLVVTRNKDWQYDGTQVFHDVESAIDYARGNNEEELFVIGGGEIYKLCLPYADQLYITEVYAEFEADAYFPDVDLSQWEEVSRKKHAKDEKHQYAFDFVVYQRK